MLTKNTEITIPPENPFQHDKLDRQKVADNLTLLIQSTSQPFVISVQSPWGWGKTTFLKMWKAQLEAAGHICLYFNAWENDFVEDPLIAFVGEINKTIAEKAPKGQILPQIKKLQNIGGKLIRRAIPLTVQLATQGLLGQESIKKVTDMIFTNPGDIANFASDLAEEKIRQYESDKNGVIEFRNELTNFTKSIAQVSGRKLPLVFFVDELDRCRPSFSIALLERIKHAFSVEGIVFVLGMDRNQLGQSVKSVYGHEMNEDGYLRRFIDLGVNLPEPEPDKYCQFLFGRMQMHEIFARRKSGRDESEALVHAFTNLAKAYHFSLRVIEQCFTEMNLVLRTTPATTRIYPYLLALLVALKTARPASYAALLGELSPFDLRTLVEEIKSSMDIHNRVDRAMLSQFEVYLIYGYLEIEDSRAELLTAFTLSTESVDPMERSYAQQVLRFAEQVSADGYFAAVKNLVAQISLIENLTVMG
jgi:hypothetical protein